MAKRALSTTGAGVVAAGGGSPAKKAKLEPKGTGANVNPLSDADAKPDPGVNSGGGGGASVSVGSFKPKKVASKEAAARADENQPYLILQDMVQKTKDVKGGKGECVLYWMRMVDMRLKDNRALAKASKAAKEHGVPLVVLFMFVPQDYIAHDRGARKIDFMLRNLRILKDDLKKLNIPLYTETHSPRRTVPSRVLEFIKSIGCTQLFANMEYEIDELRRDIKLCQLAQQEQGVSIDVLHDRCVVPPGIIKSKQDKDYSVYSPYSKQWFQYINSDPQYLAKSPSPTANDESIHKSEKLRALFDSTPIPDCIPGFELTSEQLAHMESAFPAGEVAASEILDRFLHTKTSKQQLTLEDAFAKGGSSKEKTNSAHTRIHEYGDRRDKIDGDTTSRLSAYLALGVIAARTAVRLTPSPGPSKPNPKGEESEDEEMSDDLESATIKATDGSRKTGVGRWNQEVAWRDFYNNITACFPRTSMGRPFIEKYADLKWELELPEAYAADGKSDDQGNVEQLGGEEAERNLEAWKQGMTGYPVVDAAMRCLNKTGWMHNRLRMTTAMFLTKDLMIDWRFGEQYFSQQLVDHDLASNNGGWQWSASTGVDPAPYFRVFNPYLQSEKGDPDGAFIRHFVPELASLKGKELHHPSEAHAEKLGYPKPLIDHFEAKDRAMRRFKDPGAV